jgi:hypothetical protein
MSKLSRCPSLLITCATLLAASGALADPQPSSCSVSIRPGGQLVSLSGDATAVDACGNARRIACGSRLFNGETVATGPGATAGVMVGDVMTLVGPDSAAKVGLTRDGTAEVSLERGSARVIDPRESGAPVHLRAGQLSAAFVGNDAEARIDGPTARLCGWEDPLLVEGSGAVRCDDSRASASTISVASPGTAPGATTCEARPAITTLAHLVPLPPVAAGPPGTGPTLPDVQNRPPRSPCDNPGSGCGGPRSNGGGISVSEQPVGDAPFPGGGGAFPGAGGALPGGGGAFP